MRDAKIVGEFLSRTDIKSGYNPKFREFADYEGYRIDKRRLEDMALTAEQYERAAKMAAARRWV